MSKKAIRLGASLLGIAFMVLILALALVPSSEALVQDSVVPEKVDPAPVYANPDVQRLVGAVDGNARVSFDGATGSVSFIRMTNGAVLAFAGASSPEAAAGTFFENYGNVFGITNAQEQLEKLEVKSDSLGHYVTYRQIHNGVEVFAGILRVHMNLANEITAVNGVFVPDLNVQTTPLLTSEQAGEIALTVVAGSAADEFSLTAVQGQFTPVSSPAVVNSHLYVYRDGLLQDISGLNHLVYEIEVSNGLDIREFVFVDAHKGDIVNQITGFEDDMNREARVGSFNNPSVWSEGDPLPYVGSSVTETIGVNNMITATEDVYDLFFNSFSYDSWDGLSGTLVSVWNDPSIGCPNAQWTGTHIRFCDGTTADDVVAHEWGHAYTDSTHDLIYQWQSGALNESYSDIWGELIDQINGEGTDSPSPARAADSCSVYGGSSPASFKVNAPANISGDYPVGGANFNDFDQVATGDVALVDDGTGTVTDGCESIVNTSEVSGKIALIDRGSCAFTQKVDNAITAGAIGVIVANNVSPGTITMGGAGPKTIPSVMVSFDDGVILKTALTTTTVNATITSGGAGTDDSYRWLMGEDAWAFNGAIRDMWNPTCFGDPGKVTDQSQYVCATSDNGGVHTNSGIPNHAFALLNDGGTYNGQTVTAIGQVKAAHIYWRAQFVYQTLSSDFQDHADALEASCSDLTGVNLTGFDGLPSGEIISAGDCQEVTDAIAAVELRTDPTFCGFEPLLAKSPTPACKVATSPFYSETFDTDPGVTWTLTNTGVFTEYVPSDWAWQDVLPDSRQGGFFGVDSVDVGDCVPGSDDQSGVKYLQSDNIVLPAQSGGERVLVSFEHYVATEFAWDGGNVWISVNGGSWQLLTAADFVYNAYNSTLASSGGGNTNPLAGQDAFTGGDGGTVSGSWGESQIDVTNYASAGDTIQLQFAVGVDGCNGLDGWYLDEVNVYSCIAPEAALTLNSTSFDFGTLLGATSDSDVLTIDSNGDAPLNWSIFDGTIFAQDPEGSGGIVSGSYLTEGTVVSADDISVPVTMTVQGITAPGFPSSGGLVNATALSWYIYPDASGEPAGYPGDGSGTEIWSFTTVTTTMGVDVTNDIISLDLVAAGESELVLSPGTYWLVVFPTSDSITTNRWNWSQGVSTGNSAMLIDLDGVFGLPLSWLTLPSIGVGWDGLNFSLEGYTDACANPADSGVFFLVSSGTTAVGDTDNVDIIVDTTGLVEGPYSLDLCMTTNAPAPDDDITLNVMYVLEWFKNFLPSIFK